MKVIVLGAGVVGVATAYYLARAGHEVVVVDRRDGVALETSFANGGQISANHTTPWATPGTPRKALRWIGRTDAPLLFHLRFDPALLSWLVRFLGNCTAERMRANIRRAMRLALYSRRELLRLREREHLEYDQVTRGILHVFRSQADFDEALPQVELMNRMGCIRHVIDVEEAVAIEPALAPVKATLVGGIYSPDDESGDAYKFTKALAGICESLGAEFRFATPVRALPVEGGRIAGVDTGAGRLEADAYVVSAGSYSPLLLKSAGHPPAGLSGQGLFGDHPGRGRRLRRADRQPHRRRGEDGLQPARQPAAGPRAPPSSPATTTASTRPAPGSCWPRPCRCSPIAAIRRRPSSGRGCARRRRTARR